MTAKQDVRIDVKMPKGVVKCIISIPYWWEEQECRRRSLIMNPDTGIMYIDKSSLHSRIVNLFLKSVEVNGVVKERDENKSWSSRLKFGLIKPLNDAYEKMCSDEMLNFKDETEMFFFPEKRPQGTFVAPPEVLEYLMMKRVGGLTRQDIRMMSYVEMHKFQIVGNVIASAGNGGPINDAGGTIGADPTRGLIPAELMTNPNLSAEQVKSMSDMMRAAEQPR